MFGALNDDRNVPFAQTVLLVPLLREHYVPYESLVMPDETHDLLLCRSGYATSPRQPTSSIAR